MSIGAYFIRVGACGAPTATPVTDETVAHLTPTQHDHTNFYGTYLIRPGNRAPPLGQGFTWRCLGAPRRFVNDVTRNAGQLALLLLTDGAQRVHSLVGGSAAVADRDADCLIDHGTIGQRRLQLRDHLPGLSQQLSVVYAASSRMSSVQSAR